MKHFILFMLITLIATGKVYAQSDLQVFNGSQCDITLDVTSYNGCTVQTTFSTTGTISPGNWIDFVDGPPTPTDYEIIVNLPGGSMNAIWAESAAGCGARPTSDATGTAPTCNGCTNVVTVRATNPNSGGPMWLVIVY